MDPTIRTSRLQIHLQYITFHGCQQLLIREIIIKLRAIKGLDEEIAVMRVKLLTLLDKYPERIDLQMRAIATIARMVRTRLVICEAFDKCVLERLRRRNDEVGADRLLRRLRAPRNDVFGGGRT